MFNNKGGASFKINGSVDRFFQGLNYFGSSNEETVDEAIIDFFENGSLGIMYVNIATQPSELTNGIVWKILVNNKIQLFISESTEQKVIVETGENIFNGEYLIDAQGEDVVAGIRTPHQITLEGSKRWAKLAQVSEKERKAHYTSLEEYMPEAYRQLLEIEHNLENHFHDMQDLEFTIQEEKLWILGGDFAHGGKRIRPRAGGTNLSGLVIFKF